MYDAGFKTQQKQSEEPKLIIQTSQKLNSKKWKMQQHATCNVNYQLEMWGELLVS